MHKDAMTPYVSRLLWNQQRLRNVEKMIYMYFVLASQGKWVVI